MATTAKKVPLAKAPAKKSPARPPRTGPLERSVAAGIVKATKAKTLSSPRDQVTAEILRSVARAADKTDDAGHFQRLVAQMLDLVDVLDPDRGGGDDDGDSRGDPIDRELAGILGSGPEIRNS